MIGHGSPTATVRSLDKKTERERWKLLTILMQSQWLGRSAGTSLDSQQKGHCKPINKL